MRKNNCKPTIIVFIQILIIVVCANSIYSQTEYQKKELIHFSKGSGNPSVGDYQLGIGSDGELYGPKSITIDHVGNIYILDTENKRILKFDDEGKYLFSVHIDDNTKRSGHDLCVDMEGHIYILDPGPTMNLYSKHFNIKNIEGTSREIREYTQDGKLLSKTLCIFNRKWLSENQIFPNEVYVDFNGQVYLGLNIKACKIRYDKILTVDNSLELKLVTTGDIIEGIPKPYDKNLNFLTTKRQGKNLSIKNQRLNILENKIKNYDELFNENLKVKQILSEDSKGNFYLLISNRQRIENHRNGLEKDRDIDYREIWEFDNFGKLVNRMNDIPDNKTFGNIRDFVVDDKGNIYYLYVSGHEASLLKFCK